MGIITGYLTIPNLSEIDFFLKTGMLKELGLEVKLFDEGVRGNKSIGPNGILFSGEADLSSKEIMRKMYDSENPDNVKGLTYDFSSSYGGEDSDVKKLYFDPVFGSYFAVKVEIGEDKDKILDFNKEYLQLENESGFRFVEPGYVAYEYLTHPDNLESKIESSKNSLKNAGFNLNEKETTIIRNYFKPLEIY